jgi:hypothetical protein
VAHITDLVRARQTLFLSNFLTADKATNSVILTSQSQSLYDTIIDSF